MVVYANAADIGTLILVAAGVAIAAVWFVAAVSYRSAKRAWLRTKGGA